MYKVEEYDSFFYVVYPEIYFTDGPFYYASEAQERADELNEKEKSNEPK